MPALPELCRENNGITIPAPRQSVNMDNRTQPSSITVFPSFAGFGNTRLFPLSHMTLLSVLFTTTYLYCVSFSSLLFMVALYLYIPAGCSFIPLFTSQFPDMSLLPTRKISYFPFCGSSACIFISAHCSSVYMSTGIFLCFLKIQSVKAELHRLSWFTSQRHVS